MPSPSDRRERNEALRLFVAAAISLLLLVVAGAGFYYLMGIDSAGDPFSAGLGLKNAALVSFAVSLVLILVMAVVSGGDAIRRAALHHRGFSDFLRGLLADDRLDFLSNLSPAGRGRPQRGRVRGGVEGFSNKGTLPLTLSAMRLAQSTPAQDRGGKPSPPGERGS